MDRDFPFNVKFKQYHTGDVICFIILRRHVSRRVGASRNISRPFFLSNTSHCFISYGGGMVVPYLPDHTILRHLLMLIIQLYQRTPCNHDGHGDKTSP